MTSIEDRRVCGTLLHLDTQRTELPQGSFRIETLLNLSTRGLILVLCHGEIESSQPLLARVHSSCMTSETFGGCDCDCAGQLDAALEAIGTAGRGVVFYLLQEGRGAGFVAKARDRMMVQASRDRVTTFDAYARMGLGRDYRQYDDVAFAAAALRIAAPLRLLSNNPDKVAALRRANVAVAEVLPLQRDPSPFNLHYLTSKSRSGHALGDPFGSAFAAAALPERVAYFDPHPLAERPRFLRVASYLLPIRALPPSQGVHWLRLHAFFDLATHRERVLFTYRRDTDAVPLLRVEREVLLARFPRRDPASAPVASVPRSGSAGLSWRQAVEHIVARGAGCALFVLHDDRLAHPDERALVSVAEDDDLAWLLARHVGGPAAHLLNDAADRDSGAAALSAALGRHGVSLETP